MVRVVSVGLVAVLLSACASNPPPRPMPTPAADRAARPPVQQAQRPARQDAGRSQPPSQANQAQAQPETIPGPAPAGQPLWFRTEPHEVGGREHRAFAVTAADVRQARAQAMAAAYRAYPNGDVAAHEAVRQNDGTWRFYVLMAAGG